MIRGVARCRCAEIAPGPCWPFQNAFRSSLSFFVAVLAVLAVAGCAQPTVDAPAGGDQTGNAGTGGLPPIPPLPSLQTGETGPGLPGAPLVRQPIPADGTVRVAILLPLSGSQAELATSMLNASEMAVFEIADDKFTLLPFDTKGTPEGAAAAAEAAIRAGRAGHSRAAARLVRRDSSADRAVRRRSRGRVLEFAQRCR